MAHCNEKNCQICDKERFRKFAKIAVILGALLGLICSSLPKDYQAPCHALATVLGSC